MKKMLLFLLITFSLPHLIKAQSLVIRDDKGLVHETLIYDRFTLETSGYFIDMALLKQVISRVQEQVTKEAKNAYFNENNIIMPGTNGQTLDIDRFISTFKKHFYSKEEAQINIPMKTVFPRVDEELLAEISEKELTSYVTYYDVGHKERTHNIELATNAINNYVLFPDEEFSFNEIVGERTKERGYKKAPVIVKGE